MDAQVAPQRLLTQTEIATSGYSSHRGQAVTFTATVTNSSGTIPSGELVTFFDAKTVLGSVPIAGGVASLTTSTLSVGRHSIKATYQGDYTYSVSSAEVSQSVLPVTPQISPATAPGPLTQGANPANTAITKPADQGAVEKVAAKSPLTANTKPGNAKQFAGTWIGEAPEQRSEMGSVGRCQYDFQLSSIRISIAVDDWGNFQKAQLRYLYSEWGKNCSGGIPPNSENVLSADAPQVGENKMHLEFWGLGTTKPGAHAVFDGRLTDNVTPPVLSGTLRITRNDQPQSNAEYNWTVQFPITLQNP